MWRSGSSPPLHPTPSCVPQVSNRRYRMQTWNWDPIKELYTNSRGSELGVLTPLGHQCNKPELSNALECYLVSQQPVSATTSNNSYSLFWSWLEYNSFVQGILQARILEWVAISFSLGSSWPSFKPWYFGIICQVFTIWATRKAPLVVIQDQKNLCS